VQGRRWRGVSPAEVCVHEAYESASVAGQRSARATEMSGRGRRRCRGSAEGVPQRKVFGGGRGTIKGAPNTTPSQATGLRAAEVFGRGRRRYRGSVEGLPQRKVFGRGRGTAAGAPRQGFGYPVSVAAVIGGSRDCPGSRGEAERISEWQMELQVVRSGAVAIRSYHNTLRTLN
jgi:hypothetical protein